MTDFVQPSAAGAPVKYVPEHFGDIPPSEESSVALPPTLPPPPPLPPPAQVPTDIVLLEGNPRPGEKLQ